MSTFDEIPKQKDKMLQFRIVGKDWEVLKLEAENEGLPVATYARQLFHKHLAGQAIKYPSLKYK